MNLTRQPLFKDAHNFFRFSRWKLSYTCTIQHNRGEITCKQSMSSKAKAKRRTLAVDTSLKQEDVGSDLPVLAPVRH